MSDEQREQQDAIAIRTKAAVMSSEEVLDVRAEWTALANVARQIHEAGIYKNTFADPTQIALALAHSKALGLSPVATLPYMYAIQGRIALMVRGQLACLLKSGAVRVEYHECTAERAEVTMERTDGAVRFTSLWDLDRAKSTGRMGKHTDHMAEWLRWRAVGECIAAVAPEYTFGIAAGPADEEEQSRWQDYYDIQEGDVSVKVTPASYPGPRERSRSSEFWQKVAQAAEVYEVPEDALVEWVRDWVTRHDATMIADLDDSHFAKLEEDLACQVESMASRAADAAEGADDE